MIEGSYCVMNVDLRNLVEDIVDQIVGNNRLVFHRQIIFLERQMNRVVRLPHLLRHIGEQSRSDHLP